MCLEGQGLSHGGCVTSNYPLQTPLTPAHMQQELEDLTISGHHTVWEENCQRPGDSIVQRDGCKKGTVVRGRG